MTLTSGESPRQPVDDTDALRTAVAGGRERAASAISRTLHDQYLVSDPIYSNPSTLLIATFSGLGALGRSIFQESMLQILLDWGEAKSIPHLRVLSAGLYVARETRTFGANPRDSRRAFATLLASCGPNDADASALLLKYLAATKIVNRLESWQRLYALYGHANFLACFMGMAQISLSEALIWFADVCDDEAKLNLIASYGIPALIGADESGVERVRSGLRRVQPEIGDGIFTPLAQGFGRAIGIAEDRLTRWQSFLTDGQERVRQDDGRLDYRDAEASLATLRLAWEEARMNAAPPPELSALFELGERTA